MALYLVVFYGVWELNGIDYQRIGDTATTLTKWYVAPLAAGAVVVVVVVVATVLGWWRPALAEVQRATPRWLLVGPLFMAAAALATVIGKDSTIQVPLTLVSGVLAIVLVVVLLRRDSGEPLPQAGVRDVAAQASPGGTGS